MILNVRGRRILCAAKHGNRQHYKRMYEALSDERLDELERESYETEACTKAEAGKGTHYTPKGWDSTS